MPIDPQASAQTAATIFSRVLVPVNFSAASQQAVHAALQLQRQCGARVCVFNVSHASENDQFLATLGSPAEREDLRGGEGGSSSDTVKRFVRNIAPGSEETVECAGKIGDDYVAAILNKAQEWKASLVILSHVPHPSLLRTHTEKLMQAIDLPVLLLQPSP